MSLESNKITLEYGPYEVYGIVEHRSARLNTLMKKLKLAGFDCELEKIAAVDRVVIKLDKYEIFRCRLSFLHFESSPQIDIIMRNGLAAAIEARSRFHLAERKYKLKYNSDSL